MTKKSFLSLCAILLITASGARASVAGIDVTVSDPSGRLVYRGHTDSSGVFVTRNVAPGEYIVQFNSRTAAIDRNDYAMFVAAGRHRAVADSVQGAKFAAGGVAMRLRVAPGTPIIGQVALGGVEALGTKIVNGKRYVLVRSEMGTLAGPRWVEEGLASAYNVRRVAVDDPNMIKQAPRLQAQ